jgi:D-alanyl-lipoteichoic acid acyltransferase DltB (MBOAT superfamily)
MTRIAIVMDDRKAFLWERMKNQSSAPLKLAVTFFLPLLSEFFLQENSIFLRHFKSCIWLGWDYELESVWISIIQYNMYLYEDFNGG